jgi:hypothetical protein
LSTLVVHQVMSSSEFAIAFLTLERLLAIVNQNVRFQLVGIAEFGVANFARVRSFA